MLQQEVQLNKLRAQMELQAARFEEALKREKMQSEFDVRQANLLAQAEAKTAVATAQMYAAQQIKDHMQAAEIVSMQAIAERLDQPREPRPIKDINSDALVKWGGPKLGEPKSSPRAGCLRAVLGVDRASGRRRVPDA
jgi:hypothetical protein